MNRQQLAQLEVLWTATETGDHELVDSILEQGKIAPDITDEVRVKLPENITSSSSSTRPSPPSPHIAL